MNQYWVTSRIQHDLLDLDDSLDRDGYGRVLVRWN